MSGYCFFLGLILWNAFNALKKKLLRITIYKLFGTLPEDLAFEPFELFG